MPRRSKKSNGESIPAQVAPPTVGAGAADSGFSPNLPPTPWQLAVLVTLLGPHSADEALQSEAPFEKAIRLLNRSWWFLESLTPEKVEEIQRDDPHLIIEMARALAVPSRFADMLHFRTNEDSPSNDSFTDFCEYLAREGNWFSALSKEDATSTDPTKTLGRTAKQVSLSWRMMRLGLKDFWEDPSSEGLRNYGPEQCREILKLEFTAFWQQYRKVYEGIQCVEVPRKLAVEYFKYRVTLRARRDKVISADQVARMGLWIP